jgi:hypothetical protein
VTKVEGTWAWATRMIDSGFQGECSYLLSLIRRSQRVGGVYISYRCMEGVRERRYFYVRTIRLDVAWRAHCDEATREELALVIWQDYSDVVVTVAVNFGAI